MKKPLLLITIISALSIAECVLCHFIIIPEYVPLITSIVCFFIIAFLFIRGKRYHVLCYIIQGIVAIAPIIYAYFSPYWSSEILSEFGIKTVPKTQYFSEKLPRNQAKKDLHILLCHLRKVHPLCIRNIPMEIRDEYDRILETWEDSSCVSVNEIYRRAQTLVSKLQDGHTKVTANYQHYNCAQFPYPCEITAINNIPIADLYNQNSHLFSTETPEWGLICLQNTVRTYEGLSYLKIDINECIKYNVTVNDNDSCLFYNRQNFKEWPNTPSKSNNYIGKYSIVDSCNYALLTLDNCNYFSSSSIQRFNNGINTLFSEIKKNKIDNLIIDVRDNKGGNLALVVELMRYFPIDGYTLYHAVFRRGPIQIARTKQIKNKKYNNLVFHGNVYLLTSKATYSAAMMLADCFQTYEIATIVGESPGNTANCYSNIVRYTLPYSKLSCTISTTTFHRLNPSIQTDRIKPDIECNYMKALDSTKVLINPIALKNN